MPGDSIPAAATTTTRLAIAEFSVAVQRYFINSLFHTQCCRLHLPYLAHGSADAIHARFHAVCLEAVRKIIQTELDLERDKLSFVQTLKLTGNLYGVFIATIALFTDLCLRGVPASQDEVSKANSARLSILTS